MKEWNNFLAICISRDGGLIIIPTVWSLRNIVGEKYHTIILGPRAKGAGYHVYRALDNALEDRGTMVSWSKDELIDIPGEKQ